MKPRLGMRALKTGRDFLLDRKNVWFSALCLAFAVSAILLAVDPAKPRETAFFYPAFESGRIQAEIRAVLPGKDFEDDVERILAEYLLGPVSPHLRSVFPADTGVRSVLYRERTLHVDIAETAVLAGNSVGKGIFALERTIKYAFPGVSSIQVTIDGNVPYADFPGGLTASGYPDTVKKNKNN
ncbi:MAG: GerMN domain-containing protein [Spirochaetes bacterium]|nr:GerMN domain-containing protein [Spirochaetota bacterium]